MTRLTRTLALAAATAGLVATGLVVQQAAASETPTDATPGSSASVSIATVNGSGCSDGTTRVSSTDGGTALTVMYSDYLARTGAGAEATDQRKNCLLSLDIDAPEGYTYAVRGLEYRGFAHLPQGASGLQQAEYYFQGESAGTTVSHDFTGPYDGSLERRDAMTGGDLNWAPCDADRNLNINTELRVSTGSSDDLSLMAMHSAEVPGTILRLEWKAC